MLCLVCADCGSTRLRHENRPLLIHKNGDGSVTVPVPTTTCKNCGSTKTQYVPYQTG